MPAGALLAGVVQQPLTDVLPDRRGPAEADGIRLLDLDGAAAAGARHPQDMPRSLGQPLRSGGGARRHRADVDKSIAPNLVLAYDPAGFYKAYEWIRMMMATQKADYFTAHDPDAFKALKKPPGYYD